MENLIKRLRTFWSKSGKVDRTKGADQPPLHVVSPESVSLPFPRSPRDEISVPASINGRDLSTGRL
ncbi:hypothetical protein [Rhizobium sp. FKY42]|uniref:hypothetical protein n=1 Tax=Rhizobium sp. FKY42 TaxID=2562310 RepID=UPI0010C0232C|nr:hypothetical protein [Rhizobium sp. FKY42]